MRSAVVERATAKGLYDRARETFAAHRFLRFLVVGGLNTAVGYALFYLALLVMPTTFGALCVSTIVAIAFNFVSTGTVVFGSRDPRRIARFCGVYAVVFAYNAIGLASFEAAGVPPALAGLLLLPGAVAISYGLNRSFVFGHML